jgi:hypothetical protein
LKIQILEPSLNVDSVGHASWSVEIASSLAQLYGTPISLYCHQSGVPSSLQLDPKNVNPRPIFKERPYTMLRANPSWDSTRKQRLTIARDHLAVLQQLPPCELRIFPTAFPATLLALTQARMSAVVTRLLFHHHLSEMSDAFMIDTSAIRRFLSKCGAAVELWGTTAGIALEWRELGFDCRVAPYGHSSTSIKTGSALGETPVFGILGHQRDEKDGGLVLPLVAAFTKAGLGLVLQRQQAQVNWRHPLIEHVAICLTPAEFQKTIHRCDAILITNKAENFMHRLSGVTVDSLASGVPVLVPGGTHMARLVLRFNAGVLYYDRSPQSILMAAQQFLKKRDEYINGAQNCAHWLHKYHGKKRMIYTLGGSVRSI